MRGVLLATALGMAGVLSQPTGAARVAEGKRLPAYLLIDAHSERRLAARWDDPDRPLPVGSLIKPFTALAYAGAHRFTYPTYVCRGAADGCWLPAGHGRVGIVGAIAGSCNAYFQRLSETLPPETLVSTLEWLGMRPGVSIVGARALVGFGDELKLSPTAVVHGYLELVARARQPGVSPILEGMRQAAQSGTGRAVRVAAAAYVKTGTAPCIHSPRSTSDGYTVVIYPADQPRVALLVQMHGETGAETAAAAGALLANALEAR